MNDDTPNETPHWMMTTGVLEEAMANVQQIILDSTTTVWNNVPTPRDHVDVRMIFRNAMPDRVEPIDNGINWIEDRFNELCGFYPVDIAVTSTSGDYAFFHPGAIAFGAESAEALPMTVDPQTHSERSMPLRAEDDANDTLGQEYDDVLEMGEAEGWFRDKIRVR